MGGAGFEAGIASHGRSCRYCGRRGCGDWRRGSRRRRRASDADRVGVADLDSSAGEDEGSDGVALCGARRVARGRAESGSWPQRKLVIPIMAVAAMDWSSWGEEEEEAAEFGLPLAD